MDADSPLSVIINDALIRQHSHSFLSSQYLWQKRYYGYGKKVVSNKTEVLVVPTGKSLGVVWFLSWLMPCKGVSDGNVRRVVKPDLSHNGILQGSAKILGQ